VYKKGRENATKKIERNPSMAFKKNDRTGNKPKEK
jgi:hypothetical protein